MKKMFKKIKEKLKKYKSYDWVRLSLWVLLAVGVAFWNWLAVVLLVGVLFASLVVWWSNTRLVKRSKGNGIIYGGRGKGKGLLLNHIIRKDKTKPFCNIKYGNVEILGDISEYFNSIKPLNIQSFISNEIEPIKKLEKFEKRNIYIDDINVYMPNWADSLLKKKYDSMPPMLAINRHLYDAYCIITTQDRERPYKIIKELQADFSIKAIKTFGWGWLWQCIPILNNFVYTKYIFHELPKSADMLPFKAVGVINETLKHGYLTSGQATKEVYEATNGKISYGFVLQLKKNINYDTRYFHKIVYGSNAPTL